MLPRVWEDPIFDFGAEIKTVIEAKLPFSHVTLAQEPGVLDFTPREHLHQLGLSLEAWKVGSPRFVNTAKNARLVGCFQRSQRNA